MRLEIVKNETSDSKENYDSLLKKRLCKKSV